MFGAFYDANVLYPAQLRSLLMYLTTTGLFHAKWSVPIQEEWISSLLRKRPDLTRDKLERTRQLMEIHAPGALVVNYEGFVEHLFDLAPGTVLAAAQRQRQACSNPPQTATEYLRTLEQQGLTKTAFIMREHMLGAPFRLPTS